MKNYLNGNLVTLEKAIKELQDDKYCIWCGYGLAYYERRMDQFDKLEESPTKDRYAESLARHEAWINDKFFHVGLNKSMTKR